jgi:hypothetical protein
MSDPYRLPGAPPWQSPVQVGSPPDHESHPPPRSAADHTVADLRAAAVLTAVLLALGGVLGVAWSIWSGPQQRAFVVAPGQREPFDEVETMVAADGHYLVLVGVAGLLAALLAWLLRPANRGTLVALALGVGGLGGALLTWWIGYLTGGGTYDGKPDTVIKHLPLTLHMHGLVFVEPALATMLYGLFVAFAASDDLDRTDPVRSRISVRAGHQSQHGGRHGDAARALQQGEFPPQ